MVATEEVDLWQRVVMGVAALVLLIWAVIFFYSFDGGTRLWATPLAAVVGFAFGLAAVRPPGGVVWQRVVMGLAGIMLLLGGVFLTGGAFLIVTSFLAGGADLADGAHPL